MKLVVQFLPFLCILKLSLSCTTNENGSGSEPADYDEEGSQAEDGDGEDDSPTDRAGKDKGSKDKDKGSKEDKNSEGDKGTSTVNEAMKTVPKIVSYSIVLLNYNGKFQIYPYNNKHNCSLPPTIRVLKGNITPLLNGKITSIGGVYYHNQLIKRSQMFDPNKNVWTDLPEELNFPIRIWSMEAYDPKGNLMVIGGSKNVPELAIKNHNNYELFSDNKWIVKDTPFSLAGSCVLNVNNYLIVLVGGYYTDSVISKDTFYFKNDKWVKLKSSLNEPRSWPSCLLRPKEVLAVGGITGAKIWPASNRPILQSFERFDIGKEEWRTDNVKLPQPWMGGTNFALINNIPTCLGGSHRDNIDDKTIMTFEDNAFKVKHNALTTVYGNNRATFITDKDMKTALKDCKL